MLREQLPSEPAPVVLIVEDDVLLRLTIAGSLRDAGFEVLEAANAAEAVQVLKCIPVDALFSDIDMPGRMDGFALAQWVHQRELNVRIILTSGPESPNPTRARKSNMLCEAFCPLPSRGKAFLSLVTAQDVGLSPGADRRARSSSSSKGLQTSGAARNSGGMDEHSL